VDQVKERIAGKSHELITKWEEKSREFVSNFVELFGRDGRINHWLREGRKKVARAISPPPRHRMGDHDGDEDVYSSLDSSPASSPVRKRSRSSHTVVRQEFSDSDSDQDEYY